MNVTLFPKYVSATVYEENVYCSVEFINIFDFVI